MADDVGRCVAVDSDFPSGGAGGVPDRPSAAGPRAASMTGTEERPTWTCSRPTTHNAARVVGLSYLLALVFANFAEFYVAGTLIVVDDAAATARNIVAHELLFRLGVASNLLVFALDVVLAIALYLVLRPVSRALAAVATAWRLIETATMVIAALSDLDALRALSGAGYLQALGPDQLAALARLSIGAHGSAYNIGLLFFGCGSTLFGYLWFGSGYIPRALAALGIVASLLVLVVAFAVVVVPSVARTVIPACFIPIFLFELALGGWLLGKGLRPAAAIRRPPGC